MAEQLPLEFPHRPSLDRGAFFVSPANAQALAEIDRWAEWPLSRLAIVGPSGAGKTHLAHVWAAQASAQVCGLGDLTAGDAPSPLALEGFEALAGQAEAEEQLFHLINAHQQAQVPLLLTGCAQPARWPVALPDLSSRLAATHIAPLGAPDDGLLQALLVKHFADRQLSPPPAMLNYLVTHADRTAETVARIVATIDRLQIAQKGKLSIALAKQALDIVASEGP